MTKLFPEEKTNITTIEEKGNPSFVENVKGGFFLGPGNAVLKSMVYEETTGEKTSPFMQLFDHYIKPSESELSRTTNYMQNPQKFDELINSDINVDILDTSRSIDEAFVRNNMLQEELRLQEHLSGENVGWGDYAQQLVGYMADPTNILPIGAIYGMTAKAGKGMLFGAAKAGAATAGAVALSEAGLVQPTSEIKTAQDSAIETVAGAMLGGVLGGAIGGFGARRLASVSKEFEDVVKGESTSIAQAAKDGKINFEESIEDVLNNGGNLSAAKAKEWQEAGLADLAYVPEVVGRNLTGKYFYKSPIGWGMSASKNNTIKALTREMFNFRAKTNFEVIGGEVRAESIENIIARQRERAHTEFVEELENIGRKANGYDSASTVQKTFSDLEQATGRSNYKAVDFNADVQKLMDETITIDDIPSNIRGDVEKYWDNYSTRVKKAWKRAHELGLRDSPQPRLNEQGRVVDIHREWDVRSIANDLDGFRDLVTTAFERDLLSQGYARVDEGDVLFRKKVKGKTDETYTKQRLNEETARMVKKIQGGKLNESDSANPLTGIFAPERNAGLADATKPRQLQLSNKEASKFIKHDFIRNGLRTLSRIEEEVAAADWLKRLSDGGTFIDPDTGIARPVENFQDVKDNIRATYTRDILKARADGNEKLTKQLEDLKDEALGEGEWSKIGGWFDNSMKLLFNRLRLPSTKLQEGMVDTLLWYQVLNKLGRVTLSSIPDMAGVMIAHPAANFMSKGIISGVGTLLGNKALRADKALMRKFGVAIDMNMNTMYKVMMSGEHHVNPVTGAQITKDLMSRFFLNVTGMAPWNNFWRGTAAHMSIDGILTMSEKLAKGQKLKKWEMERMLSAGFSEDDAVALYKQWKANGANTTFGGLKVIGDGGLSDAWIDRIAAAVNKEIDEVILVPGKGDVPVWARKTGLGQIVNQFQSFNQAASNRLLMPAIQDLARAQTGKAQDMAIALRRLSFMMTAIGLGVVSMDIKSRIAGKGGIKWTPEKAIAQGLSASGVTGYAAQFPLGLYGSLTNNMADRFADRNLYSLAGPSSGTVADVARVFNNAKRSAYHGKPFDRNTAMSIMPFRNADIVRQPLDYMLDQLNIIPKKGTPEYEIQKQKYLKNYRRQKQIDEADRAEREFNPIDFLLELDND